MYALSAKYYDAIYSFKDYPSEAARLTQIIRDRNASAKTLLDVACGSGKHLEYLRKHFQCEGLDFEPKFVKIASERCPDVPIHQGDFANFDLGKRFDAVTCLFSAIGYAGEHLDDAIRCMAAHLNPGGVLVVESWFTPEQWEVGTLHSLFVDEPDIRIARVNLSGREGDYAIMDMHHIVGTPEGVHSFTERHEMKLFTHEAYVGAFERASLSVECEPSGLIGRAVYIGRRR
jgi:SAM-dependent methyltransferase